MNEISFFATANNSLGDKLAENGLVAILGIVVVFAVLAIIWLSLVVFKFLMHDLPEKRKKAAPAQETVEAPMQVLNTAAEEEIIAVIAAAIAMAESENSDIKFKVVSFRRV